MAFVRDLSGNSPQDGVDLSMPSPHNESHAPDATKIVTTATVPYKVVPTSKSVYAESGGTITVKVVRGGVEKTLTNYVLQTGPNDLQVTEIVSFGTVGDIWVQ